MRDIVKSRVWPIISIMRWGRVGNSQFSDIEQKITVKLSTIHLYNVALYLAHSPTTSIEGQNLVVESHPANLGFGNELWPARVKVVVASFMQPTVEYCY
jgi:hypothetical protein